MRRNKELFCPYFEGTILDPVLFPLQHDLETGKEEKELHPPLLLDRASSPGRSGKRMCEEGGRKIPGGNFRPIGFFLFSPFSKKRKKGGKGYKKNKVALSFPPAEMPASPTTQRCTGSSPDCGPRSVELGGDPCSIICLAFSLPNSSWFAGSFPAPAQGCLWTRSAST